MLNDYHWPAYIELGNVDNSILEEVVKHLPPRTDQKWIKQGSRGSSFLPVYGKSPLHNEVRYASYIHESLKTLADSLINLCKPAPEVFVLYTPPGVEFPDHNDTGMFEITNYAACWKLRVVLQGNPGCLYFIDSNAKKIHIPSDANMYALNGTFPHGMDTDQEKLTLAIGWPWRGLNYEWLSHMFNVKKRTIFLNASNTLDNMFESMDFEK